METFTNGKKAAFKTEIKGANLWQKHKTTSAATSQGLSHSEQHLLLLKDGRFAEVFEDIIMTDKGCGPSEMQRKKSQFDVHLLDSQPCENMERFRVNEAPW